MSDGLLAFMFFCMVVSPCLVARFICSSNDHAPVMLNPPEQLTWD